MVDVLFFAELQEEAGAGKISLEADGLTIAELKQRCMESYDLQHLDQAMVALNEEYTSDDGMQVSSGDTVAFIPPVSGG